MTLLYENHVVLFSLQNGTLKIIGRKKNLLKLAEVRLYYFDNLTYLC